MKDPLFTIGHSNHSQEHFIQLLQQHGIEVLADVRSQPWSSYSPQFNAQEIKPALLAAGIRYLFLGDQLGGRPEEAEFYDDQGYVLYYRLAESPRFRAGIDRLLRGIQKMRVAIMCSEEDPAVCHRYLLVTRVVAANGVDVQHIRGEGQLQSEAAIRAAHHGDRRQGLLFQELEQDSWRSLRSVLPKAPPSTSSAD